jgi:hypothetical protein
MFPFKTTDSILSRVFRNLAARFDVMKDSVRLFESTFRYFLIVIIVSSGS